LEIYFQQSNALLILVPTVVMVVSLAWFTYWSKSEQSFYTKLQRQVLVTLRSLALTLVSILILAPVFQLYQNYKKKPLIIIATDNSESLSGFQKTYEETVNKVKQGLKDYRLEQWTFGQTAKKNSTPDFTEVQSNYTELFRSIQNTHLPSAVSAMVLVGDGIFNTGTDPVFSSRTVNYPVYTIGIGDTTQQIDAAILKVQHNQTAFLDNYFPIEVDLSFKNLAKQDAELKVLQGNDLVEQRHITIDNSDFFQQEQIRLKAENVGILNYRVELSQFGSEQNLGNNQFDFSIRVINQKQKILIVSNGASPDNAALIRLISPQKNYKYTLITDDSEKLDAANFDLIILNGLPDKTGANSLLIQDVQKAKRPTLWITGMETDYQRLNNFSPGFRFGEVKNIEYASSVINKDFDFFQLEDFWPEQIEAWPPLQVPFSEIELNGNWETLAYQSVQQIDLARPLISMGRVEGTKMALISGEGIWKWRIYDFAQNGTNEIFDDLFLKLIDYLILKPNEDNFNIYYQPAYTEDQEITLEAELLDANFEPLNNPEVELNIAAEKGDSYKYTFDKIDRNYNLNIGKLPVGNYSLTATVDFAGKQLVENGAFRVDKIQLEQTNLQANFNTLYQIAQTTGGQFATASKLEEIFDAFKKDANLESQKFKQMVFKELIRFKWLAIFIILLLILEWFLRKYWGSY